MHEWEPIANAACIAGGQREGPRCLLEDRHAMLSGLSKKIGGNLLDLSYTRGEYDVVATVEAPSLDTMTALKLSMMKTGAIAELTILEDINLNAIAKQGAEMIGLYKAPGK